MGVKGDGAVSADAKLNAAVAAVAVLIKSTIESEEPGRFAVAARLCQMAHALALGASTRVDDFSEQENEGHYMNGRGVYAANPIQAGRGRPRQLWGDGDIMREAMGTAMPLIEQLGGTQRAQTEEAETQTLTALLAARGQLPPNGAAIINTRIETLIEKIAERNKHAVVPALVLRGHPSGEDRNGLRSGLGATDAARAAGGERAAEACAIDEMGQEAVGHGG